MRHSTRHPQPGRCDHVAYIPREKLTGRTEPWRFFGDSCYLVNEEYALKAKLTIEGVKLIDNSDGWLNDLLIDAHILHTQNRHFDESGVALSEDKLDKVLSLLDAEKWVTEEDIAQHVSLTFFEWRALNNDSLISISPSVRGFYYKLSAHGVLYAESRTVREQVRVARECFRLDPPSRNYRHIR